MIGGSRLRSFVSLTNQYVKSGLVTKETVVLRRSGVKDETLGFSHTSSHIYHRKKGSRPDLSRASFFVKDN